MNCEGPTLTTLHTCDGNPSLSVNTTRNIGPKRPGRLACFVSTANKLVACFCIFKRKAEAAAILQSHLDARRTRIFSTCFSVNCLLHISINYTENVTDLYVHAQTVDTRGSSLIFQAPGYEAKVYYRV